MRPALFFLLSTGLLAAAFAGLDGRPPGGPPPFDEVNLTGEVTQTSALLQARLALRDSTVGEVPGFGDVPGFAGWGRLVWSADSLFADSLPSPLERGRLPRGVRRTGWMRATPEKDFIIKQQIDHLAPGTRYWWRVEAGRDSAFHYRTLLVWSKTTVKATRIRQPSLSI